MGETRSEAELTMSDIQAQLSEEEKASLAEKTKPPHFIKALLSTEAVVGENFRLSVQGTIFRIQKNFLLGLDVDIC